MSYSITVSQIVHWTSFLWLALSAVWLGSLPFVKATIHKQPQSSRMQHMIVFGVGLYLLFGSLSAPGWFNQPLFAITIPIALGGLGLAICGAGFSIWARLTLGENWSGIPSIKKDHTLIMRGPYRAVRHPIYTGILAALFGSALQHGLIRSFLGASVCAFSLWMKISAEEEFMVQRFGDEYHRYSREVRALIPFLF